MFLHPLSSYWRGRAAARSDPNWRTATFLQLSWRRKTFGPCSTNSVLSAATVVSPNLGQPTDCRGKQDSSGCSSQNWPGTEPSLERPKNAAALVCLFSFFSRRKWLKPKTFSPFDIWSNYIIFLKFFGITNSLYFPLRAMIVCLKVWIFSPRISKMTLMKEARWLKKFWNCRKNTKGHRFFRNKRIESKSSLIRNWITLRNKSFKREL